MLKQRSFMPAQARYSGGLRPSAVFADPERSDRAIAKEVGVSHHTVATVRSELEVTGQIAQLDRTVGNDNKSRPSRKTPQAANSTRALTVASGHPAAGIHLAAETPARSYSHDKIAPRNSCRVAAVAIAQPHCLAIGG